jgi:hypothetical protein
MKNGATRRNIPEDTILHSQRSENLKSYETSMSSLFILGSYEDASTAKVKQRRTLRRPQDSQLYWLYSTYHADVSLAGWGNARMNLSGQTVLGPKFEHRTP